MTQEKVIKYAVFAGLGYFLFSKLKSGGALAGLGILVDDHINSAAYIDAGPIIAASEAGPNMNANNRVFFEAAGLGGFGPVGPGRGRI